MSGQEMEEVVATTTIRLVPFTNLESTQIDVAKGRREIITSVRAC